jgi:hypothetical protein
MSSRSLAAARARRAGENAPPVSGNRPVTSIGSQAAFSQQMPNGMGYNMPPPPNNVRTARAMPQQQQNNRQSQKNNRQPQQMNKQFQQYNEESSNGLPFSKLSISDAIGLITLRLGKVEQWIIETEHEESSVQKSVSEVNVPEGHKIIDNATLTTIINRLDSLEKKGLSNLVPNEDLIKLTEDVKKLNDQFLKMGNDISKHTIELAKNTEQVFRFNRELTETKDILKTFMLKYDMFTQQTTQNFADYELALSDLEKRMPSELEGSNINDIDVENNLNDNVINNEINNEINNDDAVHSVEQLEDGSSMTIDLKNAIKEELSKI